MNNLNYWLKLYLTRGVGLVNILKLINHFGSIDNIYNQSLATLSSVINKTIASLILDNSSDEEVAKSLAWVEQAPNHRTILTLDDDRYPIELANIDSPPPVLFAQGRIELLKARKIAMVGTRHPSAQGIENAISFAKDLSLNDFVVVSGLAAGIDRFSHVGALQGGAGTIGVLGTGIDIVYPASNKDIFTSMSVDGLILSEFPLGTAAIGNNFARRNRIVVGLANACLVVESAVDGGSMISAKFALDNNREVFAIPGSIHNPMAKGCHKLIKSGAKLVDSINDVFEDLQYLYAKEPLVKDDDLEPEDRSILQAFGFDPISLDQLCAKLGIDFANICHKILEFELNGLITDCGGGRYQRVFK